MQRIGRYRLIGPHQDLDHDARLLLLDTNVLIEIEHFYFGTRKPHPDLRILLERFPNGRHLLRTRRTEPVDVNYGWAASEAAWRRGRGADPVAWRRLVHAADIVLQWDAGEIERAFSARRPPIDRDRSWPPALPAAEGIADPRSMVVPVYGSLLHLLNIVRAGDRLRSKGPLWGVLQYVDWCRDVFGIQASYPMSLAIALLAGDGAEKDRVRAVFKLSGSETPDQLATKCWNVAWDIAFTALSEGYSYALLPTADARPAALVTADSDPALLRLMTELRSLIHHPEFQMPMTRIAYSLAPGVNQRKLDAIIEMDPAEALHRARRDPVGIARQAARALHELEQRLGVTDVTSHDGWMLD